MTTKRRLTPDEWLQARRRWEGAPAEGFAWLAAEIGAAWGVDIGRPGIAMKASRDGWSKGAPASGPLQGGASQSQAASQAASQSQTGPDVTPAQKPAKSRAKAPRTAPPKLAAPTTAEPITDIGPDGKAIKAGQGDPGPDVAGEKPWIRRPGTLGAPSRYRPDFAEELMRYFDVEPFETIITDPERGRTAKVPGKFPMFEEFAWQIGVTTETMRTWAAAIDEDGNLRHPEFTAAYAHARARQHALLVQGTLAGAYEPRFASLAAKNMIGFRDKVDVEADQTAISRDMLQQTYATEMALAHERMAAVLQQRLELDRGGEIDD